MKLKKIIWFTKKNYLFLFFVLLIVMIGSVVLHKVILSKHEYIYAKIRVGQGFWWANTIKPTIWYLNSINEGDVSMDAFGNKNAEIIDKRYYQSYGSGQFDIYITVRLRIEHNKKTGEYTFNRSYLSVGIPVEIQFPKVNITGTVIALDEKPFNEKLIEKTVYFTKRYAFPWEYDAIKIGDTVSNGKEKIFEVIDKNAIETTNIASDSYGNSNTSTLEVKNYITVKAKVKVKKVGSQLVFGEDQLLTPGRDLGVSLPNFIFSGYVMGKIE